MSLGSERLLCDVHDDRAIEREGNPRDFLSGLPFRSARETFQLACLRRGAKGLRNPFAARSLEQRTAKEHRGRFTIANYVAT